jgi:hypothetical protein
LTVSHALGDICRYITERAGEVVPDQGEAAREQQTIFSTVGGGFALFRLLEG